MLLLRDLISVINIQGNSVPSAKRLIDKTSSKSIYFFTQHS
jgi:hypothetical protein